MFHRTQKPTSWVLPSLLLAMVFVSGVAGVATSLLGGWS